MDLPKQDSSKRARSNAITPFAQASGFLKLHALVALELALPTSRSPIVTNEDTTCLGPASEGGVMIEPREAPKGLKLGHRLVQLCSNVQVQVSTFAAAVNCFRLRCGTTNDRRFQYPRTLHLCAKGYETSRQSLVTLGSHADGAWEGAKLTSIRARAAHCRMHEKGGDVL
ncbi:hypothetical protein EVG20_g1750 [Dentipellis fragilis]|uniref:Uncharacterized protein n=1 Tax=Dentipellis fragilis TaxID=205917 RepID=A0A4Y9ZCW5_9AGAM|nr:hypothetical protein EVG20_g1750 [Dentipellis fragilis]